MASNMRYTRKTGDIESSLIKYKISVIQIHDWIGYKHRIGISRKEAWWHLSVEKCRPNRMAPKSLYWGIIIKMANGTSSRYKSHKDDWATQWRSVNVIRNGICPSMASDVWQVKKNRWHRIIPHQTRDPGNLNTTEKNLIIRKASLKRRSVTISKYQPDLKHLSK